MLKLLAEGIGIAMNGQINVTLYKKQKIDSYLIIIMCRFCIDCTANITLFIFILFGLQNRTKKRLNDKM